MPTFKPKVSTIPEIGRAVGLAPKLTGRVDVPRMMAKRPIVKAPALKKTASRKAVEKKASIGSTVAAHMAMTTAGVLGAAAAAGIINKAHSAVQHIVDTPAMNSAFDKALKINPKLKAYPVELLKSYFSLIADASPTVAKNPLLVANYMQYLIDHQGGINFRAFGELANLESQLLANERDAAPMTNAMQKALVDGAVRGVMDASTQKKTTKLERFSAITKGVNDLASTVRTLQGMRGESPVDHALVAQNQELGRMRAKELMGVPLVPPVQNHNDIAYQQELGRNLTRQAMGIPLNPDHENAAYDQEVGRIRAKQDYGIPLVTPPRP